MYSRASKPVSFAEIPVTFYYMSIVTFYYMSIVTSHPMAIATVPPRVLGGMRIK